MTRGRPPKPLAFHLVDGTYRPDRHGPLVDGPPPLEKLPPPPRELVGRAARRAWRSLGSVLIEARVLTPADLIAFAACCAAVEDLAEARETLRAAGAPIVAAPSGYPVLRPEVSLVRQASRELRCWLELFGCSPSSRRRVPMLPSDGDDDDLD